MIRQIPLSPNMPWGTVLPNSGVHDTPHQPRHILIRIRRGPGNTPQMIHQRFGCGP
jgi:hypothetical protein